MTHFVDHKKVLREIFRAQGLPWTTEPTQEAVDVLRDFSFQRWSDGVDDGYENGYNAAISDYP